MSGFSGFLAILFAIIQNGDFNAISEDETNQSLINQNLRFSPSIFFISLLTTILLSWSAFVYLLFSRNAQAELIERSKVNQKSSICTVCCGWNVREDDLKRTKSSNKSENNIESISRHLSSFESISHQVLILICCIIMFGVLPAIQPYACLPLGRFVLNYSVLLTSLAYPLGCAIALKRKCNRLSRLLFLFSIACLFVMFIFWMAVHSPKLPSIINGAINQTYVNSSNKSLSVFEVRYKILKSLKKVATTESNLSFYWRFSLSGDRLRIGVSIFMILSWFLSTLIFSYVRTMITVILNKHKGSQGLFRIGIYTQIGSIAGAAFMFVAVNHFKWFKQTA